MSTTIGIRAMLDLAAAERMKLLANRSFSWCGGLIVLIAVGVATWTVADQLLFVGQLTGAESGIVGVPLVLIIGACAVTGEYRHRTIRVTFVAVPHRTSALLVKAGVVAVAAGLLGLLVGFGGRAVTALRPDVRLLPGAEAHWRAVAGLAVVYAVSAVFAVAVGILLRSTAGAVAGLLVWTLIVEVMLHLIPRTGEWADRWLPFWNGLDFVIGERPVFDTGPLSGPWGALTYFTGCTAALLALALAVARRRDA
jgi:ABC-2 type transport system permease protein